MRTKLFAFVVFFLWVVPTFAIDVVDTTWVRRYNGPANGVDEANAVAIDDSGNVYVTGQSYNGTNLDYVTIKYYPNGDTAWVRRYNGAWNYEDEATAIAVDSIGSSYVTGWSWQSVAGSSPTTIKYSPSGDTAWVRAWGIGGADAIALDDSGNIYVAGYDQNLDYFTIRYKQNGDTVWLRIYNGTGDDSDFVSDIIADSLCNVYVTGRSIGSGTKYDYATIKYYSNGDTAWVRRYNGAGDDRDLAAAIAVDGSGNVYVTGSSYSSGTNDDYATIKYYPNGDTAWVRTYNGPGNDGDEASAIAVDGSGNVYVTGRSHFDGTYLDYATIKYFPNGDTAWVRRFTGPGNNDDYAFAMSVDGYSNVYITGASKGSGTNMDYATIKYYSNGNTAWVKRYDGPAGNGADYARAIAVDDSDNVYVTGYSPGSGTGDDYATIKYIQYDSIPFAPAVNYGAGDGPNGVFCADLDGDGDLDLAVASYDSDNVSILKNNGDGTYQTAVNYGAGDGPLSVFCADLDGDTDLDLAVANDDSDNVSILKNNGDGTYQTAVNYGAGNGPHSVFCADLDGDGDLDLAVANYYSDNVSILKNNGDGTYQTAVNYGAGDGPSSVFCADLDGDGDLDLAVASYDSDNVSILKNNGDGTYQTAVNYGAGNGPHSVFCADLDGDTDLDLTVANDGSDNVSILKNNGDGTYQSADNYGAGDGPLSVFCADLDGDTDLDLAVANDRSDNVSILKNNGDGTYQTAVNYGAGNGTRSVFCADMDGDTDVDLAVANVYSDNVSILKNLTQVPANQPPWAFSLVSPTDQDTIFGSTTFQWHIPYDPNFGDQMKYDLYVSTSPGFEPLYTTVDSNLHISKFTAVLDTGTYYWKVKAQDNWGAETWSSQTWSFESKFLSDTMIIIAYSTTANSPVDMIVTDPMGDSISPWFNTIINATYDTLHDGNNDPYIDDIVTIPDRLVGDYQIRVVADSGMSGPYDLGIRIDGSNMLLLLTNQPSPPPGEADTVTQYVPWYTPGDANGDWVVDVGDVVYTINYLYRSGSDPYMLQAGDVNCDGIVAVGDVVFLINYLFRNGPPPCSYKL